VGGLPLRAPTPQLIVTSPVVPSNPRQEGTSSRQGLQSPLQGWLCGVALWL
jgi:hypothetical protein